MSHPAQQLNQWSLWAHPNPDKCLCHGSGWLLSDYDSWHPCGLHIEGALHPEWDEDVPEDPWRMLRLRRAAYRTFMRRSGLSPEEFRAACEELMGRKALDAKEWVNAAEEVAENIEYEAREKEARAQGYSCDLERRWAMEARLGPDY